MKCPKCGAELVKAEKVCWQCYTPVDAAPQAEAARGTTRARRPRSRLLKVLPIVFLLAAAAAGYYYWSEYAGPKGCARAFCVAMEKGDAKALYGLLSSSGKSRTSEHEMSLMASMFTGADGPKTKAEVKEVKRSGATARAKVAMAYTMGKGDSSMTMTMTMPLIMVKESGGWRVDMEKSDKAAMESTDLPDVPAMPAPQATK